MLLAALGLLLVILLIGFVAARRRSSTGGTGGTPKVPGSGTTPQAPGGGRAPSAPPKPSGKCSAAAPCEPPKVCTPLGFCAPPRRADIRDCGRPGPAVRGWFDVQKLGVKNDYCRMVGGPNPDDRPLRFSCALAGAPDDTTPATWVFDPEAPHEPLGPGDQCWQRAGTQGSDTVGCPWPSIWGADGACAPAPRRADITDCGWAPPAQRGWYDVQGQGARNDYCRYVGNGAGRYFSCALAGAKDGVTPPSLYVNPDSPHDLVAPGDRCWDERSRYCGGEWGECRAPQGCQQGRCQPALGQDKIADCGLPDPAPRGWYDIQGQGVRKDFCRVLTTPAGRRYFSCALAGAKEQTTPPTRYIDAGLPRDHLRPWDSCWARSGRGSLDSHVGESSEDSRAPPPTVDF